MIIKHINHSLHKPRSNHSQISEALLDHTLHGNGSIFLGKILYLGRVEEGVFEDADDTDRVESCTDSASIGDIDESTPNISSPGSSILSPLHTRAYGKAKKTKKDRDPFNKGYGVVCLPGDINGLSKK